MEAQLRSGTETSRPLWEGYCADPFVVHGEEWEEPVIGPHVVMWREL